MKPWITPKNVLDRSAIYYFSKSITCDATARIDLTVSADTRYKLTVNGGFVCDGPCAGDHHYWKYEQATVPAELLRDGENEICVTVFHSKASEFHPAARKERPALWLEGTVTDSNGKRALCADESWTCLVDHGTVFVPAQGVHSSMPPMHDVVSDGDLRPTEIQIYEINHLERKGSTPYGLLDEHCLEPRPIPLLKPDAPTVLNCTVRGEGFCEFEADAYTTAFPTVAFCGNAGGKLKITYSESRFHDVDGKPVKKMRDGSEGYITGVFDTVTLSGKKQSFTPFWYRAFRYIRLEYPAGTEIMLDECVYRPYFYPLIEEGSFECSSAVRNQMWKISVNTLLCCTHETFVDCPYYEQCQYDMDTALEAMFMMRLTKDYRMVRKAVVDLARSQQPSGMLLAHYPSIKKQIIPTFSLFWILFLRDYVTYSGDIDLADELLPVAERVLNFFRRTLTAEGLCGATEYWHYTDWVPGWDKGVPPEGESKPVTVGTMIYSCALTAAASLAEDCGRSGLAEEYRERATAANEAVNRYCFIKEKEMYTDVFGAPIKHSQHTAVWAVLCGAKVGEEATALIDRAFREDAEVSRTTFSFSYYTFRALEKAGLYGKYAPVLFGGWEQMLAAHCTTWWEKPGNPRSDCHAWSAAPIYENSAMILGVKPLANGFDEVLIKPDILGYDSARGAVPTPHGMIFVEWEKQGDAKLLKITAPTGIIKRIILPNSEETVTAAELYTAKI